MDGQGEGGSFGIIGWSFGIIGQFNTILKCM